MIETEHEKRAKVTVIEPMGYGNPDSAISYKKKIESGELASEIDNFTQEFIKNGEGLVAVHEHDDGCIDGRCSERVYTTEEELDAIANGDDSQEYTSENHERAKVAGGGYFTGEAARLGAGVRGESIDQDIARLGTDLAGKGIVCGAHSGGHMNGEGTDCGANDKFLPILENAAVYKEELGNTTAALFALIGLDFSEPTFDAVSAHWADAATDGAYFEGSTGKTRLKTVLNTQKTVNELDGVEKPVAVTKHLRGSHNEAYIIVNFVEGKTFSQNALLQKQREQFPGVPDEELPQAFVVDAWRVVQLADAAVEDDKKQEALYAGVAYQLATAATLTDGSLKIFTYTE